MKKLIYALLLVFTIGCNTQSGPDVSNIRVNLSTQRFEKDFFALDTNNLSSSLDALYKKYPVFFGDFSANILGLPPLNDSGVQAMAAIRRFLHDYRPVYDSVMKEFPNLNKEEEQVVKSMKYVKHYFPAYELPKKLITFVGPMDAYFEASTGGYGDVITTEGLAVGLQMHLGSNFSMYTSEMGLSLFPTYLSRKFSREYISVNCIKNIVDDMFPDRSADKTLIEQMVEKGKRIFVTDLLMPDTHDTLIIGYTEKQLEGCRENEGLIWNYFIKNGLVYNNDPSLIKNYIGDAPATPEFGEGAPGYIGLFVGWQIVKKFMAQNESMPLAELMHTPPKKLFEESRYRPK